MKMREMVFQKVYSFVQKRIKPWAVSGSYIYRFLKKKTVYYNSDSRDVAANGATLS